MAKLFREEQVFHDRVAIGGLIAISVLVLYGMLYPFFLGQIQFPILNFGLFVIAFLIGVWVIRRIRLKFTISGKKITIKVSPIGLNSVTINRGDVSEIQFFKINEALISSGLTVRFGDKTKNYYLGDRAGMIIKLKDGRNRIIFSDSLYLDRERISKALNEKGWVISPEAEAMAK